MGLNLRPLQELNGYRSGSLQHYEKLKAWLHEEQHRLEFIKAHLAFTLASVEGQQASTHATLLGIGMARVLNLSFANHVSKVESLIDLVLLCI